MPRHAAPREGAGKGPQRSRCPNPVRRPSLVIPCDGWGCEVCGPFKSIELAHIVGEFGRPLQFTLGMTRPAGEESLSGDERAVVLAGLRELAAGLVVMTVQHHLPRLHQHALIGGVDASLETALRASAREDWHRLTGGFVALEPIRDRQAAIFYAAHLDRLAVAVAPAHKGSRRFTVSGPFLPAPVGELRRARWRTRRSVLTTPRGNASASTANLAGSGSS